MNNIQKNILDKIKTGEVDMKPRWHFVLKSVLLVFSVVTVILVGIYLLSFILFTLRQSGVGFVPLYGLRGISVFVMNSPWLLIFSTVVSLVALQLLVRTYSFSYRQPLVYSMIGIIIFVLLGSYAIGQTQMHQQFQTFTQERKVPVFGALYKRIEENRPENIIFGTITELTADGFILQSPRKGTLEIIISKETRQKRSVVYDIGKKVVVFGDRDEDVVFALGVRVAPADLVFSERGDWESRGLLKDNQGLVTSPPR